MAVPITAAPGDRGAWHDIPADNQEAWGGLKPRYDAILAKHPKLDRGNHANHLGTLGTGNHFIEVCLDESEMVWFMLHSGSRGVGNRMGSTSSNWQRRTWRDSLSICRIVIWRTFPSTRNTSTTTSKQSSGHRTMLARTAI